MNAIPVYLPEDEIVFLQEFIAVMTGKTPLQVGFRKLLSDVCLPNGTDKDIYSPIDFIAPRQDYVVVPTGLVPLVPQGWELQIRSKKGIADRGVTALHGIVHAKSDDELKITLFNHCVVDAHFKAGEPICQLAIVRVVPFQAMEKEND